MKNECIALSLKTFERKTNEYADPGISSNEIRMNDPFVRFSANFHRT